MPEKVCVIVFTCNRPEDLKRCIKSIVSQTFENYELLVIDNGNNPETDSFLLTCQAKVVKDKTKKLSYLFNLGWKNTNAELLVYLADDVELKGNWLKDSIDSIKNHPGAAILTGPLLSPYEFTGEMHELFTKGKKNILFKWAGDFYNNFILEGKLFEPCILCESGSYTIGQGFKPSFKEEREVDLATTSCMLIRRHAIESVNGFDENFIFNHADGDLFVRIRKLGKKIIYNPSLTAYHYNRLGPSRFPYFIGRDTAYFYLKDIRPKTIKGFTAAITNIFILNLYWIYKACAAKDIKQLSGISGFFKGIINYFKK